ncbi:hypothetical protein RIF29_18180 [Crotalaria pallida]|uniref:Uncharacterized protein n=1 Tax=Crotalaria pallida TaxID=3830 RepID=A0AAN9IKN8_CROPI
MKYPTSQPGITKKRDEVVTFTATSDQAQRVRHYSKPKGNHDDLQIMADELEKIFAEHKLRVPTPPHHQFPSRDTVPCVASFDDSISLLVPSHDYGHALSHSFSYLNFGNHDSRGKYYDKYRIKRDAKLREQWKLNRVEKEARMKAMQDILDHTSAYMNANFSGSTHSPADKLTSFKSNLMREQAFFTSFMNEDDGDLSELLEENIYGQDTVFGESTYGDGVASKQIRKNLPNRQVSSTTSPTTAGSSISHSSAKIFDRNSGRLIRRDSTCS